MTRPKRKLYWDQDHMLPSPRPQGKPGHLSKKEIAQMRAMRAAGQTVKEIHEDMGVGYHTVSKHTKDVEVGGGGVVAPSPPT